MLQRREMREDNGQFRAIREPLPGWALTAATAAQQRSAPDWLDCAAAAIGGKWTCQDRQTNADDSAFRSG
jgi:hypothetical protein